MGFEDLLNEADGAMLLEAKFWMVVDPTRKSVEFVAEPIHVCMRSRVMLWFLGGLRRPVKAQPREQTYSVGG